MFEQDSHAPFFSVVIPAYNAQDTLEETFASVANQTFIDYEIVIVDDGSADQTGQIADNFAREYQGAHGAHVTHQKNGGSAAAINSGISQARGSYICICSSDDQLLPNCLNDQAEVIKAHPDFVLFCTSGYHFGHDEKWQTKMFKNKAWKNSKEITLPLLLDERFFGSGVSFSREAALQIGGYSPSCYAEDFDFYLRLLLQGGRMWFSNRLCVRQRVSTFQKSANSQKIHESVLSIFDAALQSKDLSDENKAILQEGLARYSKEYPATLRMLEQKAALDKRLALIKNRTLRNIVKGIIQMLKPLVRPFRRKLAHRPESD